MTKATYIRVEQRIGTLYWRIVSNDSGEYRFNDDDLGLAKAAELYLKTDNSGLKRIIRVYETLDLMSPPSRLLQPMHLAVWSIETFIGIYNDLISSAGYREQVTLSHPKHLAIKLGDRSLERDASGHVRWRRDQGDYGWAPWSPAWKDWLLGMDFPVFGTPQNHDAIHIARDV